LSKKSSDLNRTYFRIFSLYYAVKHHIVAYLLFAQQEYNQKQQKHGSHVVYVIEQTDQFQKFGKTLARTKIFFKSEKSDLNQKI